MFGSAMLEVGIGTSLLLLFVSLICTAAREAIETWMKTRAADLERGLGEFFRNPEGVINGIEKFYDHSFITPLFPGRYTDKIRRDLPSYIPAAQFAGAMIDLANENKLPNDSPIALSIAAAQRLAGDDISQLRTHVEDLYNASMDRVSGWYKRRTQFILFGLGLGVAVVLNIDTLAVIESLSTNATLRQAVVAEAVRMANLPSADGIPTELTGRSIEDLKKQIVDLGLPIGWTGGGHAVCQVSPCSTKDIGWLYFRRALGWLITALAVTLGAPFWFDVLNKFIVIRSTVKPHEKS